MRKILTCLAVILLCSSMFTVFQQRAIADPGDEDVIFFDDFESYAVGTFPSAGGWTLVYNGKGNEYQKIVDDVSFSGSKSFQLWGVPGWSACADKAFTPTKRYVGYEAYVMTTGYGPENMAIHFMEYNTPALIASVNFGVDSKIYSRSYAPEWYTGIPPGPVYDLNMTYVANRWYKVKVVVDRNANTYDVWIDDTLRGHALSTQNSANIGGLRLGSGHSGVKVCFDNVKVFNKETTNALVGYWKFDEGSGSIAYDSSGTGNDGTIYGATWVDGRVGKALHFDGVDDWVRIPSNPTISGLSQITLEAWIKLDGFSSSNVKGIISKCTGHAHPTYNAEYLLGLGNGDTDLVFHVSNYNYIATDYVPNAITQTDRWYHVAASWSGDSYTIYVDGVPRKSGTCIPQTTYSNTVDLQIGRHGSWPWVYFHGTIDEVKIYNYARTPEEIWNDYVSVNQPDFEILPINPEYAVADPHKTTEFTVTVKSLNGFNQPVTLSAVYSSHELSGTFTKTVVTPPPDGSVTTTLTVSVLSEAINTHQIYITGTSGSLSHTKTATLHVPYMSVPYLSQGDVGWCLPTSVAMICRFYGKPVHQADVASGIWMSHYMPFPADYKFRVERYVVHDLGLEFELGSEWNRVNLANMLNRGLPIVVSVRDQQGFPPRFFHSVVITGFNIEEDRLFISDPSGALVEGIYTINPQKPYIHVNVSFSDLEQYLERNGRIVDSWFGINGNPSPQIGLLNIIGGDTNEYKSVSISHGNYKPWSDTYSVYWYGWPLVLTWTGNNAWPFPRLSENDYLAVYGGIELPIINPTDTARDYNFEIVFIKSGVAKASSGKLPVPSVTACGMKNTPVSQESPMRLGDLIIEPGLYTISLRLWDSENTLLDQIDLPPVWYSAKPTLGIYINSPANVFVTDSQGRSVGFDPTTNEYINEIPDAFYSGPGTEPQVILIPGPIDGSYSILLVGTDNGEYALTIEHITAEQTTSQTFIGTISQSEQQFYSAIISETEEMTAISWDYVFKDLKRGTMLKISTDDNYFQFVAPDKDFGIKHDANMKVFNHIILIRYEDNEMRIVATAVDDCINFCSAIVKDKQTGKYYMLIDKPNWPKYCRERFTI